MERKMLDQEIRFLDLSVRAFNCLNFHGITMVRDLVELNDDEVLEIRNLGQTSLREIKEKLAVHGLALSNHKEVYCPRRPAGGCVKVYVYDISRNDLWMLIKEAIREVICEIEEEKSQIQMEATISK